MPYQKGAKAPFAPTACFHYENGMNLSNQEPFNAVLYTTDELKKIVSPIALRYDVRRMWLFGSYACGEATPDSDLDFRVEPDKACGFIKCSGFWLALDAALGKKIDLVVASSIGDNDLDKQFLATIAKYKVLKYEHISG